MTDAETALATALRGALTVERVTETLRAARIPLHDHKIAVEHQANYVRAAVLATLLAALDGWTLVPKDTSLAYDTGFQDGLGEAGQIPPAEAPLEAVDDHTGPGGEAGRQRLGVLV